MADTKITALPASSGLVAADLIPVVDDPAGTPATQKATLTQLLAFIEANATAFQAADADLDTWAGITPSANAQSLVSAADYAAMRALLDLEPGTDVEAVDADILRADTDDQLTAFFSSSVTDDGSQGTTTNSGEYTPTVTGTTFVTCANDDGGFNINPPSPPGGNGDAISITLLVLNGTGAGAITLDANFTQTTGDSFSTGTTDKFLCRIEVIDIGGTEYSTIDVVALQ